MEQKFLVARQHHTVNDLLVHLGSQRDGGHRLGFATGEQRRAVRRRQVIGFTGNLAYLVGFAAIQAQLLIEDDIARSVFLDIVVVFFYQTQIHRVAFGQRRNVFVHNGAESLAADGLVLVACLRHGVRLVVQQFVQFLFQGRVVGFVRIGALHGLARFGFQFLLRLHLHPDGRVRQFQGFQYLLFRNLLALAFHHQDVAVGSGHNQVHPRLFQLRRAWVYHQLSVHLRHAHFGNGAVERDIGNHQGRRSRQTRQCVGRNLRVSGHECDVDLHIGVEIVGKHGPDGTVNQTADQDFIIRKPAFAPQKTTGNLAGRSEFLLIVHGKRQEVNAFLCFVPGNHGCQQHGIAHAHHHRAIGLLGKFSGFNGYGLPVGHLDILGDHIWKHTDGGIWICRMIRCLFNGRPAIKTGKRAMEGMVARDSRAGKVQWEGRSG